MSKIKVNPAYVSKCIDEIKRSNLSDAKRETIVKILSEYLELKEMDLEIPQHFTKEQSDWIKAYCIKRNKEFYDKALEDALQKMKELKLDEHCSSGCHCSIEQDMCPYNECNNDVIYILEQMKGENNEQNCNEY